MTMPAQPRPKGPILTRQYLEDLAEDCMLDRQSGAAGILDLGLRKGAMEYDADDKVYRLVPFGFGPRR